MTSPFPEILDPPLSLQSSCGGRDTALVVMLKLLPCYHVGPGPGPLVYSA